jgi:organic hydroperoxide reductase OsmC/OhrA
MKPFPHLYSVTASGSATGNVSLNTEGLACLPTAAPVEFGGPGDQWSPEALLTGAVASCFILSFRAVARALHIPWLRLNVDVAGTLERSVGTLQFTYFVTRAVLTIPETASVAACERALVQAERGCLVANSLHGVRELRTEIVKAPMVELLAEAV